MATTDSRTGFRLPWSTDRAASREASAEPAGDLATMGSATAESAPPTSASAELDSAASAPADNPHVETTPPEGDNSDQDATGDGVRVQEETHVTILAPGSAPAPTATGSPNPATGAPDPTRTPAAPAPAAPAPRRPTKFLADLTRAMQAAAEQARTATLEQYRADGTQVIEQIHARSATGATELRHRADVDSAAIKEWSKAEIARIREETETRIATRREQLEGQLERHAAIIEHEIEKIRGREAAFEAEMGRFFDELLVEDDPAVFAARAASLPDPPSFDDLDVDALTALLEEPGLGVPSALSAAVEAEPASTEPVTDAFEAPAAASESEDAIEPPLDREAAMLAIQTSAEAAASVEIADSAADQAEPESAAAPEPVAGDMLEPAADDAIAEPAGEPVEAAAPEAEVLASATQAAAPEAPEPDVDPRLAMLGLTPDFAAAEVAAAEEAAADVEEMPEIGSDALEARLSGLVPQPSAPAAPTVTTQVVVTGLVSVASIASFKRHLGRLAGVAHVGVSSGPDGEFLFGVQHEATTSLGELIPTLPGFGARVVGAGDGILHVNAQDPQD